MVHLRLCTLLWALPLVLGALYVHANEVNFGGPPGIKHRYLGAAKNGAQIAQVSWPEMDTLYASFVKARIAPNSLHVKAHQLYNAECYVEMCVRADMPLLLAGEYLSHLDKSKSMNPRMDRIDVTAVPGNTHAPADKPWQGDKGDIQLCNGGRKKVRARHYVDQYKAPYDKEPFDGLTGVSVGEKDKYYFIRYCRFTKAAK